MSKSSLACREEQRREDVRKAQGRYGLDFLEAGQNQLTLTVTFLGHAPAEIKKENIRIEGGVRIFDIHVTGLTVNRSTSDADQDDTMDVTVDKAGDFSTYVLRVSALDGAGNPIRKPLAGFDPRYDCIAFSFKANCPSDLDCKSPHICPPETRVEPDISYLAKDYKSFRQLILDRLALLMPQWTERHVSDLGIALVEILAYVGDHLSYFQDAVATEAYLQTARQRISVRRHVRLVDYPMHEGCNARTWMFVGTDTDLALDPLDIYFITAYPNAPLNRRILGPKDLAAVPPGSFQIFEPLVADTTVQIQLFAAHSIIKFYTWGDQQCCLAKGATSATLIDSWMPAPTPPTPPSPPSPPSPQPAPSIAAPTATGEKARVLHLNVGDILIFEEVLGPKTGVAADADPKHRQAVRLTKVELGVDTLYQPPNGQPFVYIEWAPEDALTFPLCISGVTQAPDCKYITDITVAHGNVFLIDHGSRQGELLGPVPTQQTMATCESDCQPAEITLMPAVFRPVLKQAPLTFSQPLSVRSPASALLLQDPRKALPWIKVKGELTTPSGVIDSTWSAQSDLLESQSGDLDFVVEMDNSGDAHLRFGDNDLGEMPDAGMMFSASYRVGNGPAGNVGPEKITYIVFRDAPIDGANLQPVNFFAAQGGTAPEPLAEIKLLAPYAFRSDLERAITPADYATIAEGNSKIQRAAAALRWTGSWYEASVAVDPLGTEDPAEKLLEHIEGYLYCFRRMGHDLEVRPAHYVSLDLELKICVLPDYLRGHVEAALLEVFSNRVLPDGTLGFFQPDNLTFGEGIYISKIVAAAQAVTGVESVTVRKLQRLFEPPNHELENGILPLGPYEVARLDNDPSFPEHGKLVLKVRGGR